VGRWDPSRLEQVVTNLIMNAIKFGAGRPIEIRVGQRDGVARLVIEDHGIGIDPDRLPHVFERFERAVPWANYGGLGLGLYITGWIVRAHGGSIHVESVLGQGSRFTVELPC
jgi:signal transduction histidine kinase